MKRKFPILEISGPLCKFSEIPKKKISKVGSDQNPKFWKFQNFDHFNQNFWPKFWLRFSESFSRSTVHSEYLLKFTNLPDDQNPIRPPR